MPLRKKHGFAITHSSLASDVQHVYSTMTGSLALSSDLDDVRAAVKELFAFIIAQGDSDYIGEDVSQLQHSLQAATFAQQAGAGRETVLGALLHDVGRFIPANKDMPAMIAADGQFVGNASHEIVGERYLRQLGFSETICELVGAHVMAKRYLTATNPEYYDSLSKASKTTLKYQVRNCSVEAQFEAETLTLNAGRHLQRRSDQGGAAGSSVGGQACCSQMG